MTRQSTSIRLLSELPAWDQFVSSTTSGVIFIRKAWVETLAEVFSVTPKVVLSQSDAGIRGALLVLERERGPLKISASPPASLFNGMILDDSIRGSESSTREMLAELLEVFRKEYSFGTFFVPTWTRESMLPIGPLCRWTPQLTRLVPLRPFDETMSGFGRSVRYNIRHADKNGVTLKESDDVDEAVRLIRASYRRHAVLPPFPVPLLGKWIRKLLDLGIAQPFFAVDDTGRNRAVRVMVPDPPRVYDWLAGSDAEGSKVRASHWLVANIMKRFSSEGYSTFDFMGVNTPGIREFKRSFGGEDVSYGIVTVYKHAAAHLLHVANDRLVHARRKWR